MVTKGATNFRGELIFTGEGQGDEVAPTLYLMNPREPYNTSGEHVRSRSSLTSY
jgi:gluconolactonase